MSDLPDGWVEVTLADVCEVVLGQSPPGSAYNGEGAGLPFFQGKAEFGPLRPTPRKWTTRGNKIANEGDVLVSVRAPVGPTNLAPGVCVIGRGLAALRPTAATTTEFVLHQMRATEVRLAEVATGSTFTAVSGDQLRRHRFRLPPLQEQERIVAAIEEQFSRVSAGVSSISTAKQRVHALRPWVYSRCDSEVWPRKRWAEVGSSKNGRAFPSGDYSDDGLRLLRPGNLHASGRVEWTQANTRHLPERYAADFPTYLLGSNELVINLTAQSLKDEFLGRVCLTSEGERCLLNQRIACLSPGSDIVPRFLLYALKAPRFRRFVDSLNTGSLIQHMFTRQIGEYEVPVPSRDEQLAAIETAERELSILDEVERALDGASVKSDLLRRSTLDAAFSGRLVPQDPSEEPASELIARTNAERADAPKRQRRQRT